MLSTRSSLLPYCGYSPLISKSIATLEATTLPSLSLISPRIGLTLAYLIADKESAATDNPAIPQAIVRNTSRSWKAIKAAS